MTHLDLNTPHTPLQNLLSVVADYLRLREPWLDVAEVIGHAVIYGGRRWLAADGGWPAVGIAIRIAD